MVLDLDVLQLVDQGPSASGLPHHCGDCRNQRKDIFRSGQISSGWFLWGNQTKCISFILSMNCPKIKLDWKVSCLLIAAHCRCFFCCEVCLWLSQIETNMRQLAVPCLNFRLSPSPSSWSQLSPGTLVTWPRQCEDVLPWQPPGHNTHMDTVSSSYTYTYSVAQLRTSPHRGSSVLISICFTLLG